MPRKNEPFLGLGYGWNDGENGWGSGYNEAVKVLALLTVSGIETIQNSPPTPTAGGKAYIVDTTPTGAWAGKAGNIAYWDVDASTWLFVTPKAGFEVLVKSRGDNGEWYFYSSTGVWVRSPIISEAIEAHRKQQNAHGIDNITNLQTELDKKANTEAIPEAIEDHRKELNAHGIDNVTDLRTELDKKLNKTDVPAPFEDSPFPDVWIPFNDSLRMIAGFGRDVMVEKDVVATYVNYERATEATYIDKSGVQRVAAINEPRFEKQGLLIEGQSTNFTFPSEGWKPSANASEPWVHSHADTYGFITVSGSGSPSANEGSYKDFSVPKTGTPYTFSMDIAKSESLNVRVRAYGVGGEISGAIDISITPAGVSGAGASSVIDAGNYWRVEVTRTFTGNTRLLRIYPFGASVGSSGSMGYRRVQLEELPFASSYIPTTTAAVTRAADKCWIDTSNNAVSTGVTIAISAYIETAGGSETNARRYALSAGGGSLNNCLALQGSNALIGKWYYTGNSVVTVDLPKRINVMTTVTTTTESCTWCNGSKAPASASATPMNIEPLLCIGGRINSTGVLFGHVRNLRIWHSALSDTQVRGLK